MPRWATMTVCGALAGLLLSGPAIHAEEKTDPPAKVAAESKDKPSGEASEPAYEPTSSYQVGEIEGFPVRISAKLIAEPELCRQIKDKVAYELAGVKRVLPPPAVKTLQTWPIWLELKTKGAAQFHVSRDWLLNNGFNPEKVGNVEVSSARFYLDEPDYRKTNILLHELSHAYHYHVLGYDSLDVIRVYDRAKQSGRYEKVLHDGGKETKHYGMNNPYEYFAEMSEAIFWVNDFYPFVRAEYQQSDPEAAAVLQKLWKEPPPRDTPDQIESREGKTPATPDPQAAPNAGSTKSE